MLPFIKKYWDMFLLTVLVTGAVILLQFGMAEKNKSAQCSKDLCSIESEE